MGILRSTFQRLMLLLLLCGFYVVEGQNPRIQRRRDHPKPRTAPPSTNGGNSAHKDHWQQQQQQQQHPHQQQHQQQQQKQQEDDHTEEDEDRDGASGLPWKDIWRGEETSKAVRVLFPNPKPRGLLHAAFKASKSTTLGFLLCMTSVFTFPVTSLSLGYQGLQPLLASVALGAVVGLSALAFGIWNGLTQCVWGLQQMPRALESWWTDKVWNPKDGTWNEYSLDDHFRTLQQEALGAITGGGGTSSSLTYYQRLGVPPTASQAEIKKAYRQKALLMHPDKASEPDAAEQFLRLHKAYQTLSNEAQRRIYDEWGDSYSDGSPGGEGEANDVASAAIPIDPYVFFTVVFESYLLEDYIGELSMASWAEQAFQLALLVHHKLQQQQQSSPGTRASPASSRLPDEDQRQIVEKMIRIVAASDTRSELRQVKIALHLRDSIRSYLDGETTEEAFREWCAAEARRLLLPPHGRMGASPELVAALGAGLKGTASQFRGFHRVAPFTWPMGIWSWTKNRIGGLSTKMRLAMAVFDMLRRIAALVQEKQQPPPGSGTTTTTDFTPEELREVFQPVLWNLGAAYNQWDVARTLEGACWKLFRDSGVDSQERFFRSRAVRILGETLEAAARDELEQRHGDDNDDAHRDARLQRALRAARTKTKGQDLSRATWDDDDHDES